MAPHDDPLRFVLQALDAETGTVHIERCVRIVDLPALWNAIGSGGRLDAHLLRDYDLGPVELAAVCAICVPPTMPDALFTRIARWSPLNDVPYLVHTGFELPLMLDGRKPLAVFGDGYPSDWFDDYLAPFEPFIRSGRIIQRVIDTPMPELRARRSDLEGMRDVYFALPGEEWRIDAYVAMRAEARLSDWNEAEAFERRQGSLLGYEDWQNDWWLEHRHEIGLGRTRCV